MSNIEYTLTLKANDYFEYYHFHPKSDTSSSIVHWDKDLICELFKAAHVDRNVSDIYLMNGDVMRLKCSVGMLMVSLSPNLVENTLSTESVAEFYHQLGIDAFKVTSTLNTLSARAVLTTYGTFDRYPFRMESARYSSGREPNCCISCFRPIAAPIPLEDIDIHPIVKSIKDVKSGMMIFIGSTGTGKSTSMFSILGKRLQTNYENIHTIEDPVEIDLSLVPNRKGFAYQHDVGQDYNGDWDAGLKVIVRTNPDTALIGELRDLGSVNAALAISRSNHQLFTTLHTNRPWNVPTRIFEMIGNGAGSDSLMTDFLENIGGIVAQRRVKRIDGGKSVIQDALIFTQKDKELISYTYKQIKHGGSDINVYGQIVNSVSGAFKACLINAIKEKRGVCLGMMLADLLKKGEIDQAVIDEEMQLLEEIDLQYLT